MRIVILGAVALAAAPARADDAADIAKLTDALFASDTLRFTPGAHVLSMSDLQPATEFLASFPPPSTGMGDHKERDLAIARSRDGKTAWASFVTTFTLAVEHGEAPPNTWRISQLVVKTPAGWRVAFATWTEAVDNDAANRAAIAGKLRLDEVESTGDAGLRAAFGKLAATGFDKPDAAAKELVVLGSAPGERTTSGPAFARAWNAAWAKHVDVEGASAELAPSGTTGWVAANVKLHKTKGGKAYTIPFRLFVVFDKDAAGVWQPVHVHFAVPPP